MLIAYRRVALYLGQEFRCYFINKVLRSYSDTYPSVLPISRCGLNAPNWPRRAHIRQKTLSTAAAELDEAVIGILPFNTGPHHATWLL